MEHYENQSSSNLDLAQFDDAFETAEVEEREFEAVPDGSTRSTSTGSNWTAPRPQAIPCSSGPCASSRRPTGRLLWRNNVIIATRTSWLKAGPLHLRAAASEALRPAGPPRAAFNIKLEVTKRTRGENENIYFNRRIVMADDAGAPGAAMDDMIPF